MHGVVLRVQRKSEEDDIQASIIDLLKVAAIDGLIYFAVPNGGKRPIKTAKLLKGTGVLAGVLDIILICPTTRVIHFLEVKTGTGVMSADQAKFIKRLTAHAIPWAVARSRDEAQDILTNWGFLRVVKLIGSAA